MQVARSMGGGHACISWGYGRDHAERAGEGGLYKGGDYGSSVSSSLKYPRGR